MIGVRESQAGNRTGSATKTRINSASVAAAAVLEIFDTMKSTRTGFDSYRDRVPPDGMLDRGEFPSQRFDAFDRLGVRDGRISRDELQVAFTRLPAARSQAVSERAATAHTELIGVGERARQAMLPFGVGIALAVAGLLAGGAIGGPLLLAGLAGVVAGVLRGFDAAGASVRIRKRLLADLDRLLAGVL